MDLKIVYGLLCGLLWFMMVGILLFGLIFRNFGWNCLFVVILIGIIWYFKFNFVSIMVVLYLFGVG